jgi:hypothetical protein
LVKFGPFENQRPDKPTKPSGPSNGKPEIEYVFSTSSSDPDGDSIQYLWDWGDGNFSELMDSAEANYVWLNEDKFEVRVMAIDENGGESDWSDPLVFSIPRCKDISSWIFRLIQYFPNLEYFLVENSEFLEEE